MSEKVFVFGTLKRGFPLHEQGLSGARLVGLCRTRKRYPMLIAGPWYAPMMFNEPGVGCHVHGELYEVDEGNLKLLDRLESVGKSGNFREAIEVESEVDGAACSAFSYMKARELADPVHSAYLALYDDRRFIPFDQRS